MDQIELLLRKQRVRKHLQAQSELKALVTTPATIPAGGTLTLPGAADLHVVMRTAVVGSADFMLVHGRTVKIVDVPLNGEVKLGWFEKNTVLSFAPAASLSFDVYVRTKYTHTAKIASHL